MAIDTRTRTAAGKPGASARPLLPRLSFKRGISGRERKFFTEQMALLLETGTPLQQSLYTLRRQLDNPAMLDLVDRLSDDIGQGMQFSAALARHPDFFPTTYINLIAASEDGGFMHEVLQQLLALEEKREQLRQTMVSALSYPAFLMIFAFAVVVFVLVVVFPKFADLFEQIGDQLPVTTRLLMASSDILKQHWIAIAVALGGALVGFRLWAATESGASRLDWLRLNVPLARQIYIQMYLVNSLRVLALSLANGVGMLDALEASRHVVDNRLYRRFIAAVAEQVETGNGISAGFRNTGFIPPIVEQMIATGEETGKLPKVLNRLADYFENELAIKLRTVSRLAEPVMLLIMGGVVGVIVSSLILPIFKLTRVVG